MSPPSTIVQPSTHTQPSPSQPVSLVELVSTENSKITAVSVYPGRAEITRSFKFKVQTGQNQVTINGLPNFLDQDTLRVEGRAVDIYDVTVSNTDHQQEFFDTSTITKLIAKKEKTTKALERRKKVVSSLESYLETLDVKDTKQVGQIVKESNAIIEELDNRVSELEKELQKTEDQLEKEWASLIGPKPNDKLRKRVVIGVFADKESKVEIALFYAVHGAFWTAGYDIRVNTHTDKEPITLIYKASIVQKSGEDWTDVPLTLETATPTFGMNVPELNPWNLSVYKPASRPPPPPALRPHSHSRSGLLPLPAVSLPTAHLANLLSMDHEVPKEYMEIAHRLLNARTKGKSNVSTTLQVPGLVTIPSDGVVHNVTIVKLSLGTAMSWVCVPKKSTNVHLNAKIKNTSQYTLLRAIGNIYVNGDFITNSEVPTIIPEESFDCRLGLDPSIRVTYHPLSRKQSESRFHTKTTTHIYTQIITVHNTKSTSVERVHISDQIPVSDDSDSAQLEIKLLKPSLPHHPFSFKKKVKDKRAEKTKRVVVSRGVKAMWEGADEKEVGGEVGRNGKFCWVVALPGHGKVNLVFQYEVVVPAGTNVVGLA